MRSPGAEGPFRIGVDVGGTFTDVCVVDGAGALHAVKSPSVPMDPAAGVFSALEQTARTLRLSISDLLSRTSVFVHGSTIATNTLLERKGARVGLLATRGFRDTIEIRRGWRENPWDHRTPWPAPLVPRHLRWGVAERISADGAVLQPLQRESLHEAIDELQARGVESIAVCLLHSHRNQEHEAVCRKVIARRAPDLWISLSCELAPLIGEYERSSTTVVNAYVAPKVVPYLRSLEQRLQAFGLGGLLVVQSNGGMASVSQVARRPVSMILSGPAAAAGALTQYAADAGSQNLISIEVGGTSCDVMLMNRGSIGVTDLLDVGGFRMTVPSVEITTVGAGGGSLASVDSAGLLSVGPQGVGAAPGPACYGRGGTLPTMTDAQLVLGRLRPGAYAGGSMVLDRGRAEAAIRQHIAGKLGVGVEEAAIGIVRIGEQTMLHAVEQVSIERGFDPAQFALLAGGGAGPLHAARLARMIGCRTVMVPRLAGVLCAFGMCNTDIRRDFQRSALLRLDRENTPALRQETASLRCHAEQALGTEGCAFARRHLMVEWSIRYIGQQSTVTVPVGSDDAVEAIAVRFEAEHERLFGHVQQGGAQEVATIRVAAFGLLDRPSPNEARPTAPVSHQAREWRNIWIDPVHGWTKVPVFAGFDGSGASVEGPALIEEDTTTILLGVGDRLRTTPGGNYLIELS